MQDYELDAWLGDAEVTTEQRAALAKAFETIAARYPAEEGTPDPDAGIAYTVATQIVLVDENLHAVASDYLAARRVERDRWAALVGAMIAAAATGVPETRIAETAGVTRMTVRKALGK